MKKTLIQIVFLMVLLACMGCEEEVRTTLNVEERKEVNKRYKEALDSINKMMITECTDRRQKKFNRLVDSLKTTRIEEIELITKVKGNEK